MKRHQMRRDVIFPHGKYASKMLTGWIRSECLQGFSSTIYSTIGYHDISLPTILYIPLIDKDMGLLSHI